MTNGSDTAFARDGGMYRTDEERYPTKGLTKREHFAAMAMQGMLANARSTDEASRSDDPAPQIIADVAVIMADRLIRSLNEKPAPQIQTPTAAAG